MNGCLTKPLLLSEVSGCLIEKPECSYCNKFGFSIICRHPDHAKFHAHVAGALTIYEAKEQYEALRLKRRDEFIASLDETSKEYFCYQTDFFGQPITNLEQNEQHLTA